MPGWLQRAGMVIGFLILAVGGCWTLIDPTLSTAGRLGFVLLFTILWWLTEPIPIAATGLLSVVVAVALGAVPVPSAAGTGGSVAKVALAPFADPSVFFLLGGMFLARGMVRHGLDRRLALSVLSSSWAGRSPFWLLLAVGLAVGSVSMFVSNTAATAMVYPVVIGIIGVVGASAGPAFARSRYASCLLLMTAYSASIWGVATPIGTATNVVAMGFLRQPEFLGVSVDFGRWMLVGFPTAALTFVGTAAWLWWSAGKWDSQNLQLHSLRLHLKDEQAKLGPWKQGERNTLLVLLLMMVMWVTPSFLRLASAAPLAEAMQHRFPEEVVALLAPVLLFLLPSGRAGEGTLIAEDFAKIDWSTILLFGSGLSLGNLLFQTGLAKRVGVGVMEVMGTNNPWVIAGLAALGGILLSEFTSNAATASTLLPVINALCQAANVNPIPAFFAVTFAASLGSALPVSTPPNAIVYGSGLIPVPRMIRAGIGVDVWGWIVLMAVLMSATTLGWKPS
ncbi:DASS family sodium-coupled anion symporter [bacterium]|nr:DASS family sodium-coupled anion symporter [bacterium]